MTVKVGERVMVNYNYDDQILEDTWYDAENHLGKPEHHGTIQTAPQQPIYIWVSFNMITT